MKPRRAKLRSRRAGSRGVTLVELMIAVTIGLLLIVVIAQLFLGSRQTFATTDDISRMQDNIRFSQQLLTRTIHLAGYKSQANSVTATVFKDFPALGAVDSPGTASDQITVRFQGAGTKTSGATCQADGDCPGADGTVVDCLGVKIDAGIMAVNTFSVATKADGRNALFCFNGSGVMPGVEIVSDVENMQIMFGEDTDGDLVANRYVTPSVTIGAANVQNVVSVRLVILFATPTESSKAIADPQTFDMLGDGTVKLPYTDRRIRRLVATTVNLRNRTP